MNTNMQRSLTLRVRKALEASGASKSHIEAALNAVHPRSIKRPRMSQAVKGRIIDGLSQGNRLVLTLDKRSGIRVYTMDGWKVQRRNTVKARSARHPNRAAIVTPAV